MCHLKPAVLSVPSGLECVNTSPVYTLTNVVPADPVALQEPTRHSFSVPIKGHFSALQPPVLECNFVVPLFLSPSSL